MGALGGDLAICCIMHCRYISLTCKIIVQGRGDTRAHAAVTLIDYPEKETAWRHVAVSVPLYECPAIEKPEHPECRITRVLGYSPGSRLYILRHRVLGMRVGLNSDECEWQICSRSFHWLIFDCVVLVEDELSTFTCNRLLLASPSENNGRALHERAGVAIQASTGRRLKRDPGEGEEKSELCGTGRDARKVS